MGYFLLFIFCFIFIMFIIIALIFNKSKTEGIPYKVGKKFIKEFNPKLNEDVKLWHNERTDEINIYLKGTVSGNGKVGTINSRPDLKKFKENLLNARIHKITEDTIFIKFY